jgi:hypothetical protein
MKQVPRRLSATRGSRHFDAEACLNVKVTFDGVERKDVLEYDLDKQWVLVLAYGADGKALMNVFRNAFVTKRLHGKLEVTWK